MSIKLLDASESGLSAFWQVFIPSFFLLVGTVITLLAKRKSSKAETEKIENEARAVPAEVAKSYAEAASTLATAHATTETNWRNLVQTLAAEVDKYKKEKEEWGKEKETYKQEIYGLKEALQVKTTQMMEAISKEREDCESRITKMQMEIERRMLEDKKWFLEQLTILSKSKE